MSNEPITLSEVQQQADEWIRTYGVRYFNELTNMAVLTEEVGELARVIARTYGEHFAFIITVHFSPYKQSNLLHPANTFIPCAKQEEQNRKGKTQGTGGRN